jgi:hypothetical protein
MCKDTKSDLGKQRSSVGEYCDLSNYFDKINEFFFFGK